jgi:hypothetical protein
MITIKINKKNYEISFLLKNEKKYEINLEKEVLENYNIDDIDYIEINDKNSKINEKLLNYFLTLKKRGKYENKKNEFLIKMQKYYETIEIEQIEYGNAIYAEETMDDYVDWNNYLSTDILFLNKKLIKRYKKIKEILETVKSKNIINITDDKIEIIQDENFVTITPEYKSWENYGEIKAFFLKKINSKIKLENKLELAIGRKFEIGSAENGTFLAYDNGTWEYCGIIFYNLDLEELENISEEEGKKIERLIKTIKKYFQPLDANELEKFLKVFKKKWEEKQSLQKNKKTR